MPRFDRLEFEPSSEKSQVASDDVSLNRDEQYWLRLADENRRSGCYESALRFYSRALEHDRSLIIGWLGQIQMLIALEEYPEADLWGRKALELFRNHGDLMAGRAQALCRHGDRGKGLELCDGALQQEGQSAYRWMVRGELMLNAKQEIDRHCFDKAIQLTPDWLIPLEIALAYQHHGLPSQAQHRARQAVEKAPQSPYAWYILGCCELEMGLDEQAKRNLERCLELSPKHVDADRRLRELATRGWSLKRGLRRLFGRK